MLEEHGGSWGPLPNKRTHQNLPGLLVLLKATANLQGTVHTFMATLFQNTFFGVCSAARVL